MTLKRLARKADSFLKEWKSREHKPLIVSGARQIGKTECIREFGKTYSSFVEINFKTQPEYRSIISRGYTSNAVIQEISSIDATKKFISGKTLLFFDEVQAFPDIITSLKPFCEDGRYDVICSGSLLGLNYASISSVPIGYKEDYVMRGLDFEEFLVAKGYGPSLKEKLLSAMVAGEGLPPALYETLRNCFYDFVLLGGMPEVVYSYIKSGNFSGQERLQEQILLGYRDDMKQYASGLDKTKIESVFDSIPSQLAKENPKFLVSKIRPNAKGRDYEGVKEWLADSGIVLISRGLNFPELPLRGNVTPNNFRLYFADTGLLIASLDPEAQRDLRANKNLGVYKGAVFENLAADAFAKEGLDLYFYKRPDGTLKEDFFARTATHLVPIEVKFRDGRSKSMRTLIDSEKYGDVAFGIKLSDQNISHQNEIYTFPHFLAFLVKDFLSQLK